VNAISDQLVGQGGFQMTTVSLAEAKARISAPMDRAASGEPVRILRRGKPVAQITAISTPRKPIDAAALRAMTDRMPVQPLVAAGRGADQRSGNRRAQAWLAA
jgi:prevent-host-death family protein